MRERAILEHVFAGNARLPGAVIVPPGDDLAAVRLEGPAAVLLGVDQVVDGRHVRLDRVGPAAVGRKAVARCVSDVAAMAGVPCCALATAAVPAGIGERDLRRMVDAMQAAARDFGAPLVGGDVAGTDGPLVLTVTVVATPGPAGIVERRGARVGDGIYVTGALGAAWQESGGGHHLDFTPRVPEALALAELLGDRLHAGIDVSDGLGTDAGHVARASNVRLEIEAARIPCRGGCDWRRAVGDGEDYELLFFAAGAVPEAVAGRGGGPVCRVTRIGTVRPGESGAFVRAGGIVVDVGRSGWEHAS